MDYSLVNTLILDYGLIFGKLGLPNLGIKGAAWATVISWGFIFCGMFVLLLKDKLLKWKIELTQKGIEREILKISAPIIVTQIITPFTLMFLTWLLAKQSPMAVAAYGVAGRIETLLMIGILGVSTSLTPFIAQNLGAKMKVRIDAAIQFGGKASTYLGIVVPLYYISLLTVLLSCLVKMKSS